MLVFIVQIRVLYIIRQEVTFIAYSNLFIAFAEREQFRKIKKSKKISERQIRTSLAKNLLTL